MNVLAAGQYSLTRNLEEGSYVVSYTDGDKGAACQQIVAGQQVGLQLMHCISYMRQSVAHACNSTRLSNILREQY